MPKKRKGARKGGKRKKSSAGVVKGKNGTLLANNSMKADKAAAAYIRDNTPSKQVIMKAIKLAKNANRTKITKSDLTLAKLAKSTKTGKKGKKKKGKKGKKKGKGKTTQSANDIMGLVKELNKLKNKHESLTGQKSPAQKSQMQLVKEAHTAKMKEFNKQIKTLESEQAMSKVMTKIQSKKTDFDKLNAILNSGGYSTGGYSTNSGYVVNTKPSNSAYTVYNTPMPAVVSTNSGPFTSSSQNTSLKAKKPPIVIRPVVIRPTTVNTGFGDPNG